MNTYVITVGYWLRAYSSATIQAMSDADAIEMGSEAALAIMNARAQPDEIDPDSRCAGVIVFLDRVAPGGRRAVAEDVGFAHANDAPPGFQPQQS